jgi:uncharacterized integral membrane protein
MRRDDDIGGDGERDDEELTKARAEADRLDRDHLQRLQRARQARGVKVIIALAVLVILIVFIVSNSQRVEVNFVFVDRNIRLIWVMLACAILGGIVGFVLGRPGRQFRFHREEDEPDRRRR